MTGLHSVLATTISAAFVFGLIVVLLGQLRSPLAKRLNLAEEKVDWLLAAVNLTLIPMMLAAGILVDHFEIRAVVLAGSLVMALALLVLAQSTTPGRALGAILLIGAGGACLSTGSTVLMRFAFWPDREAASQNLGNVFFALGALTAPLLAEWSFARLGYRRGLGVVAVLSLVPSLVLAMTQAEAFPPVVAGPSELIRVLQNPIVWLAGLALLLYVPLEGSLGTWGRRYLRDLRIRERWAAWLLAAFWLTFLGGRLLAAIIERNLIARDTGQGWLLVVLALASAVCLGNMAGAPSRFSGAAGLLLVGFCFGPIFPTLVGLLFEYASPDRGTAYGSMFAIGAAGNLFLQPLIALRVRQSSVQRAMRVPMFLALGLTVAVLIFVLFSRLGR